MAKDHKDPGEHEEPGKNLNRQQSDKQRFDALWWIVITVPVLWWAALLVFVLMDKVSWGIFISTGFIVQGSLYVLQSLLRMLIGPLGRGYKRGHFIGFLFVGFFWAVLGTVLLFVTKEL